MDYLIMLDSLGQRYGCLPSEILARGDTIDIGIMVKSIAWYNERDRRTEQGLEMPKNYGYSTEQLKAMIDKVKGD